MPHGALDHVDQPRHADADRPDRLGAGGLAEVADHAGGGAHDAVGAELGGLAQLGEHLAVGGERDPAGLGGADVEAEGGHPPDHRGRLAQHLGPGGRQPWSRGARGVADAGGDVDGHGRGPGPAVARRPPSRTTTSGQRVRSVAATAGCRWASRTCTTSGRPAGSGSPGATTTSAGRPHGTCPTAMVGSVSTRTTTAPVRSGSVPSTRQRRGGRRRAGRGVGRGSRGRPEPERRRAVAAPR